ncbi:MAG: hypothetical protein C4K60_06560 [Ideonella sp. MAG2]|nr:MAG: hypothetical protein C4K60_06560 [Ideonella sp. MAG2]
MRSHPLSYIIRILCAAGVSLYAIYTLFNLSTVAFKSMQPTSWPRFEGKVISSEAKKGCGKPSNFFMLAFNMSTLLAAMELILAIGRSLGIAHVAQSMK